MSDALKYIRQNWSQSKVYRFFLVAAALYALFRLVVQGAYLLGLLPGQDAGDFIPLDLQVYLDAAQRLQLRQDLYLKGTIDFLEHYIYSPFYALAFVPFTQLPPVIVSFIHTILHILVYGALYVWWNRIFDRLNLEKVKHILAWTLPLWLVFSPFWDDLGLLNIYVIMALLVTLLFSAVLEERLGWSFLWVLLIMQVKPHWTFAAAIPLLLGRYRFFLKLIGLAIVGYVGVVSATSWALGLPYGWQQYTDYFQFLSNLSGKFPWRGPDAPFLGYNHSITQTLVYWFGETSGILRLATGVKLLLLAPLGIISVRHLLHPVKRIGYKAPQLSLGFFFALYLGVFIWLDVVWELTLSIAIFPYLLATLDRSGAKLWASVVFLPYALLDVWRIASIAIFGPEIVLPGLYISSDPNIYFPLIMLVNLTFYGFLVNHLWNVTISYSRQEYG